MGGGGGFNRKAEAQTEREGKKRMAEELSSPPANDNKWNQNKSRGVEKKKKERRRVDTDLGQEAQRQRCPSLFLSYSSSSAGGKKKTAEEVQA